MLGERSAGFFAMRDYKEKVFENIYFLCALCGHTDFKSLYDG